MTKQVTTAIDQIAPSEIGRIVITPPKTRHQGRGWSISVYEPDAESPAEIYAACTRQAAIATAACLLAGVKVPVPYWNLTEVPHAAR